MSLTPALVTRRLDPEHVLASPKCMDPDAGRDRTGPGRGAERSARAMLAAVTAVTLALASAHGAQRPDPLRVLFLGASYFTSGGGSQQPFEGFCATAGLACEAVSQQNAPPYPHGVTFLGLDEPIRNPNDAASSPAVHQLIRDGEFDFVVVWAYLGGIPDGWLPAGYDQRFASPSYEETLADLQSLHATISSSGARTVLYMWHPWLPFMDLAHPVAQLYWRLRADLAASPVDGQLHDVTLIPVGLLWLDAVAQPGSYDAADPFGIRPPRFSPGEWYADPGHPGPLGQYANGCILFTYLTGQDPRTNPFAELPRDYFQDSPDDPVRHVAAEDAQWIKRRAWYYYATSH